MPAWIGESDVHRAEEEMRRDGAPGRDLSAAGYDAWRQGADPANLDLIGMYSQFLSGQCAGMTDALSLPSIVSAMDLLAIAQEERADKARRLILLHGLVVEEQKRRRKSTGG